MDTTSQDVACGPRASLYLSVSGRCGLLESLLMFENTGGQEGEGGLSITAEWTKWLGDMKGY
jgi:hypothetical protein